MCPSPICFLECSPILHKETLQWLNIWVIQGKGGGWRESGKGLAEKRGNWFIRGQEKQTQAQLQGETAILGKGIQALLTLACRRFHLCYCKVRQTDVFRLSLCFLVHAEK